LAISEERVALLVEKFNVPYGDVTIVRQNNAVPVVKIYLTLKTDEDVDRFVEVLRVSFAST
tara:strand:+ start:357 stop:539 length:183 start_codon:yes stop_codon:yes gene_type:complete